MKKNFECGWHESYKDYILANSIDMQVGPSQSICGTWHESTISVTKGIRTIDIHEGYELTWGCGRR